MKETSIPPWWGATTRFFISYVSQNRSRSYLTLHLGFADVDRTKAFHSFRVMCITALKRCDVSEYLSAEIVGHERGRTMSYGYYTKDSEIYKLYECTERAVAYIKQN